jgi:hypothetical protein
MKFHEKTMKSTWMTSHDRHQDDSHLKGQDASASEPLIG